MPRNLARAQAAIIIRDWIREPAQRYSSSAERDSLTGRSRYAPVDAAQSSMAGDSLLSFAGDRYYWSLRRIARLVWGLATTIPLQLELLHLMKQPAYATLLQTEPRFRFKFLIRDYLVRGFSPSQRTACFLHHYRRLHASLSAGLLQQILHRSVTVFEAREDGIHVAVTLCYSRPFEKEGELSFSLHVDDNVVYVLSFTIAPGWVVQSEDREIVLITRLQGTNGYYPQIRAATKTLHDVGPAALLLAALDGFGQALEIHQMAGVTALRQSTYTEELSPSYRKAYDAFFSDLGIETNSSGFFLSVLPPEDRPMSSIKKGHKIRTREKRQFKRSVADTVYRLLRRD